MNLLTGSAGLWTPEEIETDIVRSSCYTAVLCRIEDSSDVKNLDVNGSASILIHLHPSNSSWIST